MKSPKQKRSSQTLERVIQTAERLLRDTHADDVTIAQVVADSGVSVGSIYGRFGDKEGVFSELVLRFMRSTLETFQTHDRIRWQSYSLKEALNELVHESAIIYQQHRGVIRAISLRSRFTRAEHLSSAIDQYNERVAADVRDLLMLHADKIQHPEIDIAIQTSIEVLSTTLKDSIVHSEAKTDLQAIETRVVDLLHRFLTHPGIT